MKKITLTFLGLIFSLFCFSQTLKTIPLLNGNFLRVKVWRGMYLPHGLIMPIVRGDADSTSLIWHDLTSGRIKIYQGKGMWFDQAYMKDLTWNNISGKPDVATPVNADWNATTGYGKILNKPVIPTNNNQLTNGASYLTIESDPVFIASPSFSITATNKSNWNTAFSWGNHAGLYRPITYVPTWSEITSKPLTLSGYGITDAYTQAQTNTLLNAKQNSLTFDNSPTAASDNPVKSSGIKAADDLKESLSNKVTVYSSANTSVIQYPSFSALQAGLATKLTSASITGGTAAPASSLLSLGNTTVTVTFASSLADNNYQAFVMLNGVTTTLLGNITATITTKSAGSCIVTLKNTGLITINISGLTVDVIALKTN